MKEKELNTTVETLGHLWYALDRARPATKAINVDRQMLVALLIDHAAMADALFTAKYRREA